jgi:O-antigen ligase
MIKWLFKYGTVLFLFNTILLSIESTFDLGYQIFLAIMGIFAIFLLLNPQQIKIVIFHKAFNVFLILNLINIFYFIVSHNFYDYEAGKYLIARYLQFSIISFSIYYNYDYFKEKFLQHIAYAILAVIILGLIVNPYIFSGRYSGLVWNPNMLASFSCIAFAALFLNNKKQTNFEISILFLFILISLATGSRGVLLGISLAFVFKYGFTIRNIIYAALAVSGYFILLSLQLDTSINRFASQELLNDRILQYKYAYETVFQQPFFGWGLDKYDYINTEIVPSYLSGHIISAHNGYLAILVQYGFVFGLLVVGIIFYQTIQFFLKIDTSESAQLFYLYIIIYGLLAALYETLITGINEFHTILFWLSIGFLSYSIYKKDYGN